MQPASEILRDRLTRLRGGLAQDGNHSADREKLDLILNELDSPENPLNLKLASKKIVNFESYANELTPLQISEMIHSYSNLGRNPGCASIERSREAWDALAEELGTLVVEETLLASLQSNAEGFDSTDRFLSLILGAYRRMINGFRESCSGLAAEKIVDTIEKFERWLSIILGQVKQIYAKANDFLYAYESCRDNIEKPENIEANRDKAESLRAQLRGKTSPLEEISLRQELEELDQEYVTWESEYRVLLQNYFCSALATAAKLNSFCAPPRLFASTKRTVS